MASKMIGVEIGNDSIKLAVCSDQKVQKLIVESLPENMVHEGMVSVPEAMTELLTEIRKEYKLPKSDVALVLPSNAVIANVVTMPLMSEAELKINLPYEFRDFIGQDSAKYRYDYAVIRMDEKEMELYAAAVRIDLMDSYYEMFKKAGFTIKVATPVEMAWQNLIRLSDCADKEICIIDLGHAGTHVNIYKNGTFVMGRNLDLGSQLIDATISAEKKVDEHTAHNYKEANMDDIWFSSACEDAYNAIALEVMKVLSFYRYDTQSDGDIEAYYCGGGSFITPLRDEIIKATDVRFRDIARLIPGNWEKSQDSLRCALAASAGLQTK